MQQNKVRSRACRLLKSGFFLCVLSSGGQTHGDALVFDGVPDTPAIIAEKAESYLSVSSTPLKVIGWRQGGQGLCFIQTFGKTQQAGCIREPGGHFHPITFSPEPVNDASFRPNSNELVYLSDTGGNEFDQIYQLSAEHEHPVLLTDGKSRNKSPVWDHSGQKMIHQTNARDGKHLDLALIDLSSGERKLAYEAEDNSFWEPVEFSSDGSDLLVWRNSSTANSGVHLVNLATSKNQQLFNKPSEAVSINKPVGFDRDGGGVWLISNKHSEFNQFIWKSLSSDVPPWIVTENISWDVELAALSRDKKMAAFAVNEAGYSRLYLLDIEARKYQKLYELPKGKINGLLFSEDDQLLAVNIQTISSSGDVYVVRPKSPFSTPELWYTARRAKVVRSFIEPELVSYPTFDAVDGKAREIPAWVYRSKTPGPRPVIVSIHGGPESQSRPVINPEIQMWVALLDATVVVPNVRGSTGYGKTYMALDDMLLRKDSIKDIGALLDWIALQPEMDVSSIALHGRSYGGFMVLASAIEYNSQIKAAVDVVGISNFTSFLEGTPTFRRDRRRVEYGDERIPEVRDFLDSISPLHHVDRIRAPMFVIQGKNDSRVPYEESRQMVDALRQQSQPVPVWFMTALNEGHIFKKKENIVQQRLKTVHFFQTHGVGGDSLMPEPELKQAPEPDVNSHPDSEVFPRKNP